MRKLQLADEPQAINIGNKFLIHLTKTIGIKETLLTCDDDNIASIKVIESQGGVLENSIQHNGVVKRRYWIKQING